MKYKFVKIKDNRTGLEYPWIMKCTNFKELISHTEKYMGSEIGKGVTDWFSRGTTMRHLTTHWAGAVEHIGQIRGGVTFIETSLQLENEVLSGKLELLNEYGCIYLRANGTYMIHSDSFEITDEIEMSKMVYPEYGKSDINIIQWPNGTHFYAKLGNMDVVDADGNQKWDTYDLAHEAAVEYLKE